MKAQTPAEGIVKLKEWPDTKYYKVPCNCGCESDISVMIEVDGYSITTSFSSTTKTKYWYQRLNIDYTEPWLILNAKLFFNDWYNRFVIVWQALIKGYVQTESDVILSSQQTLNFSETLKLAITDFEKKIKAEKEAHKSKCQ